MALPLFCHGFLDDLGLEPFLGIHFLQAPVLFLKFLHAGHQGRVHAPKLGPPLVERGIADGVLPAQIRDWRPGFGLIQDADDLAIGKS